VIHFRFPLVLLLYVPLLLMWLTWTVRQRKNNSLFSQIDGALEDNLFQRVDFSRIRWQKRLGVVGLMLLVFAASGPQIGTRLAPVERKKRRQSSIGGLCRFQSFIFTSHDRL